MKVVAQRVARASVDVEDKRVGAIDAGLLLLVGIGAEDVERADEVLTWMADKIVGLRIFRDEEGRMNRSVKDIGGSILAVSQFTLYGDTRKGKRPSFIAAAAPEEALQLFDRFVELLRARVARVETGQFGASMQVELLNDGPVTLILER